MAYNEELNDILREIPVPETNIQLVHARYNNGPIKVGLRRVIVLRNGDVRFSPIGRMTVAEFDAVRKLILSDAVRP